MTATAKALYARQTTQELRKALDDRERQIVIEREKIEIHAAEVKLATERAAALEEETAYILGLLSQRAAAKPAPKKKRARRA